MTIRFWDRLRQLSEGVWSDGKNIFYMAFSAPGGLTASRLVDTNSDNEIDSVLDLTDYVGGTANEVGVTDDGDGTVTAGLDFPIILENTALLGSETVGAVEFFGGKLYFTAVSHRRVLDRTSDVAIATVTVANTVVETTLWTGHMGANSLTAGNVFKFHADGVVSNNGPAGADEVTIRVRVGGVVVITLSPNLKTLTNEMWHIDANATQRTIGVAGSRAVHMHLVVGDPIGAGDEVFAIGVANIDTTANMDVTITAQWASAKAANTISLYQGFMEYKN